MIFGLWLGFTAFAGAVALLFWLVLHFSFQVKYQGSARVEVVDYGIGIAKEDLSMVWKRFYQVKPYERNKTGTGIGLNIASEILKMHYAPYGVESTPNEGTCFWFMLEVCDDEK